MARPLLPDKAMRSPLRLLLLAALVSSQITGCASRSKSTGTLAAVGGAAAAVLGTAMLVELKSPGDDTNGNGVDDFPENDIACALGGCLLAVALIIAGVTAGGAGLLIVAQADEPGRPAPIPAPAPQLAHQPVIDARLVAPLPEVATDDQTLRMAQQARGAARRGDCAAAWATVDHIHQRDPRYGDALARSRALARCQRR